VTLIDRIRAWYRKARTLTPDIARLRSTAPDYKPPCPPPPPMLPATRLERSASEFFEKWDSIVNAAVDEESKKMKVGRFQIFEDKQRKFRWRLRAANGRIVASSEAYSRKYDAIRAVQAIDKALHPGYIVEIPE
jgi:uncharacterized protein YegP (UPF0339 family)